MARAGGTGTGTPAPAGPGGAGGTGTAGPIVAVGSQHNFAVRPDPGKATGPSNLTCKNNIYPKVFWILFLGFGAGLRRLRIETEPSLPKTNG